MNSQMCDFSQGLQCPRCGYLAKQERTFRVCRTLDEMATHLAAVTAKPWIPVPNPMVGDRVAKALAFLGVTKERVSKAVGGDCGCAQRQTGLNHVGGVVAKAVEKSLDSAVATFLGPREEEGMAEAYRRRLLASADTNQGLKDGPPSA
jgi:hypothetical protein